MKNIYFLCALTTVLALASCEKEFQNYPDGYDNRYYALYDYNYNAENAPSLGNTTLTVNKSDPELIPLKIKFMSEFVRDYDVEVRLYLRNSHYFLSQLGVIKPPKYEFSGPDSLAVPGIDFNLTDETGKVLIPIREDSLTFFRVVFPQARKGVQTLYLKSLNNTDVSHIRCAWLSLSINKVVTDQSMEIFQQSCINNITSRYQVSSTTNSYYRRINIR